MPAAEGQVLLDEGIGVVDDADDADGIGAQVGADEQGLGVGVADTADGRGALHFVKNVLEFGAEGGIFDVVNLPLQPNGRVIGRHAAPACAQMRMIVRAEKHIGNGVVATDGSKKASHNSPPKFLSHRISAAAERIC